MIQKHELCSSCLNIHPIMSNGEICEHSIEDFLDSTGNNPLRRLMMYHMILTNLELSGGCPMCISLFRRAAEFRY